MPGRLCHVGDRRQSGLVVLTPSLAPFDRDFLELPRRVFLIAPLRMIPTFVGQVQIDVVDRDAVIRAYPSSLKRDAREFDHPRPFLGFILDQRRELSG
jgi:hypothetical protein